MWTYHAETEFVIQEAWKMGHSLSSKLKNTKVVLKRWNKEVFGHVQTRIAKIKADIAELQAKSQDHDVVYVEQSKQWELEELLKREELLWRDKAKAKWMEDGDANTHFFHVTILIHRRRNAINQILDSSNHWITEWAAIGEEFKVFYNDLFSSSKQTFPNRFEGLFQPCISDNQNHALQTIPTGKDIYTAIFSMGSYKSPGLEDMTVTFFKKYWKIVGPVVIDSIQRVFRTHQMPASFNHTFLTLIPKSEHVSKVDQFRPIALCNVIFKAILNSLQDRFRAC